MNQIIKNIPVKRPIYFAQQPKVHIPRPQHKPIIAIVKSGKIIIRKKFLICMLHWKRIKQGS